MNLRNIQGQKGLHILAGLAQEITTSPTFMVGCPAQPYIKSIPQNVFNNASFLLSFSLKAVEVAVHFPHS